MRAGFKFRYVSPSGGSIDLSAGGLDADGGKLADWSLETTTLNGRIAGLRKKEPVYTIPVIVATATPAAGVSAKNALYEIPATDVANRTPGRLYFNDWYIEGYMTASKASNFWQTRCAAQYELTFTATDQNWTRESQRTFSASSLSDGSLNYPHDFAFDYASSRSVSDLTNENFLPAYIRLDIQGPATNPAVFIGGNRYKVDVTVNSGERLVIDGRAKTIDVVDMQGNRTNVFGKRAGTQMAGSGEYVFEMLKPGQSSVVWEGLDSFSVTVYEQRAEPRWS